MISVLSALRIREVDWLKGAGDQKNAFSATNNYSNLNGYLMVLMNNDMDFYTFGSASVLLTPPR